MRKLILASFACAVMSAFAGFTAFQASSKVPPPKGLCGEIVYVQACSTNPVSSAVLSSVTDISVGGTVYSFTNELANVNVTNGIGNLSLSGAMVYPSQRLVLTGDAFPGGAVTVWMQ